ncbi:NYN domain-containing protein [Candidatus Parcubacteria bacterium]|nr:NYN domain-containing protein [Candidatus Parcubacteria bacterium]
MKKIKQNNYAFIDSQNLNLAIRDCGWNLNFKKFYIYLQHKYRTNKVFLFIGYISSNKKLYLYLEKIGYTIIYKPVIGQTSGFVKGNVDAELVLHVMLQYKNFDKAIIISGDGDFYCLIEQLLKDKKLLKIGIPNKKRYSALLRKFSKYLFYVSILQNKLKSTKKGMLDRNASQSVAFYRD